MVRADLRRKDSSPMTTKVPVVTTSYALLFTLSTQLLIHTEVDAKVHQKGVMSGPTVITEGKTHTLKRNVV